MISWRAVEQKRHPKVFRDAIDAKTVVKSADADFEIQARWFQAFMFYPYLRELSNLTVLFHGELRQIPLPSTKTKGLASFIHIVDGWNPAPLEVGSLSHYLQGFIHPRCLFRTSSISRLQSDSYLPKGILAHIPVRDWYDEGLMWWRTPSVILTMWLDAFCVWISRSVIYCLPRVKCYIDTQQSDISKETPPFYHVRIHHFSDMFIWFKIC